MSAPTGVSDGLTELGTREGTSAARGTESSGLRLSADAFTLRTIYFILCRAGTLAKLLGRRRPWRRPGAVLRVLPAAGGCCQHPVWGWPVGTLDTQGVENEMGVCSWIPVSGSQYDMWIAKKKKGVVGGGGL